MNVLGKLQRLALDVSHAMRPSTRPEGLEATTPDQTDQLDRLLAEVRENEKALGAEHWSAMASAFQSRLTETQPQSRASRYRYKPAASHLLPLGGVVALVGLTLSQLTPPLIAQEAPPYEAAAEIVTSLPAAEVTATRAPSRSSAASDVELKHGALDDSSETTMNRRSSHATPRRSSHFISALQTKPTDEATTTAAPASMAPSTIVEAAPQSAVTRATSTAPADTFAAQLSALKRADKALKAGRLAEAKAALNRDFSSQLDPHAKALNTILSCQSGARESGQRSLAAQEQRFPNSPYLERMRRACQ